jgi:hypothetical protein
MVSKSSLRYVEEAAVRRCSGGKVALRVLLRHASTRAVNMGDLVLEWDERVGGWEWRSSDYGKETMNPMRTRMMGGVGIAVARLRVLG